MLSNLLKFGRYYFVIKYFTQFDTLIVGNSGGLVLFQLFEKFYWKTTLLLLQNSLQNRQFLSCGNSLDVWEQLKVTQRQIRNNGRWDNHLKPNWFNFSIVFVDLRHDALSRMWAPVGPTLSFSTAYYGFPKWFFEFLFYFVILFSSVSALCSSLRISFLVVMWQVRYGIQQTIYEWWLCLMPCLAVPR